MSATRASAPPRKASHVPTKDGFYTYSIEQIDKILEHGKNFRVYNAFDAEAVCEQIERNRGWPDTGASAIVFAGDSLIDGQHRLGGYRLYQQRHPDAEPIMFRTVVIPADNARSIELLIDAGRPRSFADYLRKKGVTARVTVAALVGVDARLAMAKVKNMATAVGYAAEAIRMPEKGEDGKPLHWTKRKHAARRVPLVNLVDRFQRFRKDYEEFTKLIETDLRKTKFRSTLMIGQSIFAISRLADPDMAKLFLKLVATGDGIKTGDPIFKFRELLQADIRAPRTKRHRLHYAALVAKTWNAWINNEPATSRLLWRGYGYNAEDFPVLESGNGEVRR